MRAAQEQFELAIKHDPTYARAYSGLADVYNLLEEYLFAPKDECREKRRSYVTKAIALDPNLPEARVSLASLLLDDYRFAEAELQFRQAIALNPSYATAHHWYGLCLRELGRLDEAMSEFLIAEELDPLTSVIRYLVCDVFLCRGSLDESFARIQKMREIDPESPFTYSALVDYHLLKGEFERALDSAKELKKLWSASGLDSNLAYIFAVTDRQKEAKEILARLEKEFERGPISPAEPIAWGYVGLNDLDACFKWLERAFDRREKIFGTIRFFPLYRKVRDDQRFNELLRRANLPLESTRTLGS